MSGLNELQRNIYSPQSQAWDRPQGSLSLQKPPIGDIGWKKPSQKPFWLRYLWLFIIAFFIMFGGALILLFGSGGFSENKVEVVVDTDQEVSGVELVEWKVRIVNKNKVDLENVEIMFEYPENTQALEEETLSGRSAKREVGLLQAGQDVERVFKGRLFGAEDEYKKARVLVSYRTPGISRSFEKEIFSEVKLVSSPILLTFQGPDTLQNDAPVGWNIKVSNISDYDFENLRVRLVYPEGFSYIEADPAPQFEQTTWEISSLKIGQEKSIVLKGKLAGALNDQKELQAFLEFPIEGTRYLTLTKKIASSKITIEPLSLSLTANGNATFVAHTGETITLEIAYKNNTTQILNDVVIEGQLVGDALDPTSVETTGTFDPTSLKVRWDYTNTPELKEVLPSQDGKVTAVVMIKNKLLIKKITDKNFQVRLVATITSENPSSVLPAQKVANSKELAIPVGTNLLLQVQGEKDSTRFTNSGSIPPVVNRLTTYTVIWRITNTSNDVGDVVITATLPSYAQFTGSRQVNFEADNFYYDKEKRQMVWTMKKLPATTGFALPVYEAAFQIGITPGSEHVGKIIDILGSTQVKGIDIFTNEVLNKLYDPMRTDLDGELRQGQAAVVTQ